MPWPWQRVRHYRCPDGSVRTVHRIDDILPLYLENVKTRVDATVDVLKQVNAHVGAQHETTIKDLLFKIDDKNTSAQQQLRAAYVVYMAAPCDKLGFLERAVDQISTREHEFRRVELFIRQIMLMVGVGKGAGGNKPSKEAVEQLLIRAAGILSSSPAGNLAANMARVQEDTNAWASGA